MGNLGYAFTWLKNMRFGSWKVNVVLDGMPQKVATAFGQLSETLVGAVYDPIAYLGSQMANGINHAILAEQTIVTGKDNNNVVLVIINEQPQKRSTLVSITPVLSSGAPMGGITVDVETAFPKEAKEVFDKAFEGFVGTSINPFVYLGSQIVNGSNYFFAAEVSPLVAVQSGTVLNNVSGKSVKLITVNSNGGVIFEDILG